VAERFKKTSTNEIIDISNKEKAWIVELFATVKNMEREYPELVLPADLIHKSVSIEDRILFYEICDDVVDQIGTHSGEWCPNVVGCHD